MRSYKAGDEVIFTPKGVEATVIRAVSPDVYSVEWKDKDLIPPQMDVDGFYLVPLLPYKHRLNDLKYEINKETNCPKCGREWTETIIGRSTFYDCLTCKLKKEDA